MRIGILGLDQAGKRTLFSLLTGRKVPETNKPGDLVEGVASIHDPRVDVLSKISQPEKTVYAENHFVLCPPIAEQAIKREWLDGARKSDLLCLVVRAFESDQVYHPSGSVKASRDRANLEAELALADMELIEKRLAKMAKEKKAGQTLEQQLEEAAITRILEALEAETDVHAVPLDESERSAIRGLGLLSFIPKLWTYNVGEDDVDKDFGPGSFAVSCQIEQEISEIDNEEERQGFLEAMGVEASGLDRLNAAAYDALGLMSFYTIGKDEVRAWTIRKGSLAPRAGGKVHSDIERGFIRVEITKYDDLVAAGSEKGVKEKGLLQVKGRDYTIQDGDICHFLFNV